MRFFIVLLIAAGFVSCKKESVSSQGRTDLLTERSWVIKKLEQREMGSSWVDFFLFEQPCKKDDRWVFKSNRSLELNESELACSGGMPNTVQDIITWDFTANETQLLIEAETFDIHQLDAAVLVLYKSVTISGVTSELKITYEH